MRQRNHRPGATGGLCRTPRNGGSLAWGRPFVRHFIGAAPDGAAREDLRRRGRTGATLSAFVAAGEPRTLEHTPSLVDSISSTAVFPAMFARARDLLEGSIVVTLDEARQAIRLVAERNRVIMEGASACAVAAALSRARVDHQSQADTHRHLYANKNKPPPGPRHSTRPHAIVKSGGQAATPCQPMQQNAPRKPESQPSAGCPMIACPQTRTRPKPAFTPQADSIPPATCANSCAPPPNESPSNPHLTRRRPPRCFHEPHPAKIRHRPSGPTAHRKRTAAWVLRFCNYIQTSKFIGFVRHKSSFDGSLPPPTRRDKCDRMQHEIALFTRPSGHPMMDYLHITQSPAAQMA